MNQYSIGQVIYVVLRKEARVYPMQVTEIITKKTLEGEVIAYMIKGGTGADQVLSIDQVDGEIFDSADKVKRTLIERASAGISQRIEQAVEKAKEWYPTGFEQASDDALAAIRKQAAPATSQTAVPAKLKRGAANKEVAALGIELQQDSDQLTVEMPDGTKARVRNVKLPPALQG